PALRFPACFTPRVMRPIAPGALSASRSANPVVVEKPEFVVKPAPTPPRPAETLPVSGPHQMPSHLLLHPSFDITKPSTAIADGEVIYPAAHNRIDKLYHPIYRLRVEASEDIFEFAQQCGALLELGRIERPPFALQASYAAELKA